MMTIDVHHLKCLTYITLILYKNLKKNVMFNCKTVFFFWGDCREKKEKIVNNASH